MMTWETPGKIMGIGFVVWWGSTPITRVRLVGATGGGEEGDQRLQLLPRQVSELSRMALHQRLAQFGQQCQPRNRDADPYDAAVVGWPLAPDQAALLQLVEHP